MSDWPGNEADDFAANPFTANPFTANPFTQNARLEQVILGEAILKAGSHIRLRPRRRADALDLVLAGRLATVESIEQDFEGQIYLAVTVDDDPGRDFGLQRQPGHRFFYALEEIEPLDGCEYTSSQGSGMAG